MDNTFTDFRLGWEEWVALHDLGWPALEAKIDTGAKTSALHAKDIEPFGSASKPQVRFTVQPIPNSPRVSIPCAAPIIDHRDVTSSNGQTERRYVIRSNVFVGNRSWPIEITLTDREQLSYRMLIGRQALQNVIISPNESHCQPKLRFEIYQSKKQREGSPDRPLRIAVLSRENNYSTRRLVEAGEERGHTIEVINTIRCYMAIDATSPQVHYDGARLPRYDAVIPRIGASITPYGTAVIRQFETIGTFCVNGSYVLLNFRPLPAAFR